MTNLMIPTRKDILSDFNRCARRGDDRTFQFRRAVRRWIKCGYDINELPHLIKAPAEAYATAIQMAADGDDGCKPVAR